MSVDRIKSTMNQFASLIAAQSCDLRGINVFFDEIRSMAATVDEVKTVLERIGSRPVVSVCLEIQSRYLKDLENVARPTCGFCCHFQAHPPRCQLSKRYISPNQFSCKKYSPKHNPRK